MIWKTTLLLSSSNFAHVVWCAAAILQPLILFPLFKDKLENYCSGYSFTVLLFALLEHLGAPR